MDESMQNRFVEEAQELINNLENEILNLETDFSNQSSIDEVFRVMHTLKGTAAMFGFNKIGDLTHHLENIYDAIREKTLVVNKDIIDLTLQSVDLIQQLLHNKEQGDTHQDKDYQGLLSKIIAISGEESKSGTENLLMVDSSEMLSADKKLYYIYFKPASDIFFRGINPYTVFEELREAGEFVTIPELEEKETPENKENFDERWGIFLVTDKMEDDLDFIFMFYQVDEYKITQVNAADYRSDKQFIEEYLNAFPEDSELGVLDEQFRKLRIENANQEINEQEKEKEEEKKQKRNVENQIKNIKVPAEKLDELINLVGELVITNSQLAYHTNQFNDLSLSKLIGKVDKLSKNLRENTLELRLVPIHLLTSKFKRLIRDLSVKMGKEVEFVTEGVDTELDSNIINHIDSPLMHIIRNGIDHGIESPEERKKKNKPEKGIVRLFAYHSGSNVFIQVQDDGRGINPEMIRKKAVDKGFIPSDAKLSEKEIYDLIFLPGFSTAQSISNVSGRGVGMDVVKKSITDLRGEIEIDSEIDLGTSFTLKLPLTLSIIDTLTVKISEKTYLIPLNSIESCHKQKHSEFYRSANQRMEYNNELIPVIYLRNELRIAGDAPEVENLIIINVNDKKYAFVVDKVLGEHQAVVKPLSFMNSQREYFSGASILGNGQLALILDTNQLINRMKEQVTTA